MKKYVIYVAFAILLILLGISTNVQASAGSTVFIGEPVILNDYNNIEITYNKVDINEETSEISNLQLFTNLSSEKVVRKASVKLEDSYSRMTINSLKININGVEIENFKKIGDEYVFYFEILPNEGKKIEITYKTDNDLQNAKIIKYTMEKLKGKEIKLFQINVIISKYDIPLVEKIWPGAYEYDNNTVSTEYFDFKVNNLTSQFVIQKETYRNLKYGDYAETYTDIDEYIINHAKEIIDDGFEIKYQQNNKNMVSEDATLKELTGTDEEYPWIRNKTAESIFYYKYVQELGKKNEQYSEGNSARYKKMNFCLTNQEIAKIQTEYYKEYNKKVAINYYETEQGKDLYVRKNNSNSESPESDDIKYTKKDEYTILRTDTGGGKGAFQPGRIFKDIYVNSDIDGNKIEISENEILDFVNMMNVDLYIRRVLYDPRTENEKVYGGYYTDSTKEIMQKCLIEGLEESYKEYNNYNERARNYIEERKTYCRKFDNEDVVNNAKIPVVAQCVGVCEKGDNGYYEISFIETDFYDGYFGIYDATECDAAKQLLEENEKNNENIKNGIVSKITNTKISLDTEEYKVQEEIITNENIGNSEINVNANTNNDNILNKIVNNPIILGTIIIIIALIIILILFIIIRITRGKKNGGK